MKKINYIKCSYCGRTEQRQNKQKIATCFPCKRKRSKEKTLLNYKKLAQNNQEML